MNVAILGLWHLGSVTAACLAHAGHRVTAWDPDADIVAGLANGHAPIAEPGLDALLSAGLASGRLSFTADAADALRTARVVWVAFDTPVDDDDRADVDAVMAALRPVWPNVPPEALVISSAQLPVGSVAAMERQLIQARSDRTAGVASIPENLRLGTAIERFQFPDRIVVGLRSERDRVAITELLQPVTDRLIWMTVESAEMTKHAINAFLATSIAFINEIAAIGELAGADAKDVERGLKSDQRIGPAAYLSPGGAFAGGTLARDLVLLGAAARRSGVPACILDAVLSSNHAHRGWAERTLRRELDPLAGKVVALWGLTYKPGTDTLRRSISVELARRLTESGAAVRAFDPTLSQPPDDLDGAFTLATTPLAAAAGADAVVVGTEWPAFRAIGAGSVIEVARGRVIVDPGRFLAATLGADRRLRYLAVGTPA